MRSVLAIFFYCFAPMLHAIGQDSLFKKNAIFLTFEEFRTNRPSIDTLKLHLNENNKYNPIIQYETGVRDSLAEYTGGLWAFSDNNQLYIKYDEGFGRFIILGRYCVFLTTQYSGNKESPFEMNGGNLGIALGKQGEDKKLYYTLNDQTGQIELMKIKKVKKYLADNQKLSDEYKNEPDKEGTMLLYIRKYNQQHQAMNQSNR
jgi:hypothetical protein